METYERINIDFQEEYKRLDKLCKDCNGSFEGVSEYIRQMENTRHDVKMRIESWENDYKMLKHVRWVRNKLSHEVGTFQSDICMQSDLDFVKDFYNRIMKCVDPLVQARKIEEQSEKFRWRKAHVAKSNKKEDFSVNKATKKEGFSVNKATKREVKNKNVDAIKTFIIIAVLMILIVAIIVMLCIVGSAGSCNSYNTQCVIEVQKTLTFIEENFIIK